MDQNPPGRRRDDYYREARINKGSRPEFDTEPWRRFAEASTPRAFCQSWLPLQCRMLRGVRCAMVLLGNPDTGPFSPVAVWPDAKKSMDHLTGAAERALKERRGLLVQGNSSASPQGRGNDFYHVAYPIEVSGKIHGVVVLEIEPYETHEIQNLMRQLHWGAAWLEVLVRRADAARSEEVNERLQRVLDLVAGAVEKEEFHKSAMDFVTRLATSLECDRVSLGFLKRGHVRVETVSHIATLNEQTNLLKAIGAAMDEAVDQNAVVIYPEPQDAIPLVTRAHEELHRLHGTGAIMTIPLVSGNRTVGGLTLERSLDQPFDKGTVETCETVAALVSPILVTKRLEERWLIRKALDSAATQVKRLVGPGYLVRKLILIMMVALATFFSLYHVDYKITAPTSIEGLVQRVVAAPFDGYIKDAHVRPGDVVRVGQVLCTLDDRDLRLERIKWTTERDQLLKQYNEAMAKHDRAQIQIIRARIEQARARIDLLDEQLKRTKVVAPFSGVVMSGDLSQSLGAPVERGEVLFELAPLDQYRVISEVDERDIGDVVVGQEGELLLHSIPGKSFAFTVKKITPVSIAKEGRNYFRIEGSMETTSSRLRPRMEGVAKIKIDRRRLIWVWTHEAINWLRLQLWRWRP